MSKDVQVQRYGCDCWWCRLCEAISKVAKTKGKCRHVWTVEVECGLHQWESVHRGTSNDQPTAVHCRKCGAGTTALIQYWREHFQVNTRRVTVLVQQRWGP